MENRFKVSKSQVLMLGREDLITVTQTFIEKLIDCGLTVGEARAILKDALDTVEGIAKKKVL